MYKLLLYDEREQLFEAGELLQFFNECDCVSEVRSSPDVIAAAEGEYQSICGGTAIVRLISSCRMVVVEGESMAVVEAVVALNTASNRPLHVIDEGYMFDIPLAGIQTPGALEKAILGFLSS